MESKFCGIHMKDHNIFSEDRMVAYMIPNTLHLTAGLGLEPGEIYPSSFYSNGQWEEKILQREDFGAHIKLHKSDE